MRLSFANNEVSTNRLLLSRRLAKRKKTGILVQNALPLGCAVLLSASMVLPFSSIGQSIGGAASDYADFGGLQSGRQALGDAAASLVYAFAPKRTETAATPPKTPVLSVANLRPLVEKLHRPEITFDAAFDSTALKLAALPPLAEPEKIKVEPGQFRRISRFGLTNEVDFTPTATASIPATERLPPLAQLRTTSRARLQDIAAAAATPRLRKSAKAEFSAAPFVPGMSAPQIPAMPAGLPALQHSGRSAGRRLGPV